MILEMEDADIVVDLRHLNSGIKNMLPQHIAELYDIVTSQDLQMKPIMFMYTDGGPDHRLTYLSVQLSLISLFLKLDLDFVCLPYLPLHFIHGETQ